MGPLTTVLVRLFVCAVFFFFLPPVVSSFSMHRFSRNAKPWRAILVSRRGSLVCSRGSTAWQQVPLRVPQVSYPYRPSLTQLRSSVSQAAAASSLQEDEENHLVVTQHLSVETNTGMVATKPNKQQEDALLDGLTSRPVPGGNWNPENPLEWTKSFGSRSPNTWEKLQPLIHLRPGDDGYYEDTVVDMEGVTLVRTREEAERVLKILQDCDESVLHACDTEVMAIDLKEVGPVGNGYVTCLSIYSGPDIDYGNGPSLWIDNLDHACGILQLFRPWLENERFKKVWHNYGFDRHVLWNEGINVQGFGGDTMHMARLQDTSRVSSGGYSLEALTDALIGRRKQPMKELFGVKRKRKDGTDGLMVDIPAVEVLQRHPMHRQSWIKYSCYDAEGTWLLREELQKRLEKMSWCRGKNLYDYYQMHMRPFGEVLTDMERRGIRVDARDYLAGVEVQARADRAGHLEKFRRWAALKIGPDGLALNPASSMQLTTFLFGGALNEKTKAPTESVRVLKVARDEITDEAMEAYRRRDEMATPQQGKCQGCFYGIFLCACVSSPFGAHILLHNIFC
jgi:hypothetical protein